VNHIESSKMQLAPSRKNHWGGWLLILLLAMSSFAHAEQPPKPNPDPWEGFNRKIFGFNDSLDRHLLKPVASFYLRISPTFVVKGVSNFFDNLHEPITILNQLLQGKVRYAIGDTGRFVINTTVGVAGLIDVASHAKLTTHREDFGLTLGTWGVGSGPYLVLPLLGPSTVRDVGGRGADWYDNPLTSHLSTTADLTLVATNGISDRAELIPVEGIVQGDRYLFIRDAYLQHRDFELSDGKIVDPFLDEASDDAPPSASAAGDAVLLSKNTERQPYLPSPATGRSESVKPLTAANP